MDGLKQRIIGALVLVSLAVIFVPMIFDEPHSERTSTPIQIPEEPPFPEVNAPSEEIPEPPVYEIEESVAPEATSQVGQPAQTMPAETEQSAGYRVIEDEEAVSESQPAADNSVDNAAVSAGTDQQADDTAESQPAASGESEKAEYTRSLEGAWVVQLGSFGNPDNARRLRDQVREKGYGSHLQELTRGDTALTRVFSGPFASKSEAEAAKRVLDDAFNLNSLVTEGDK
ncbi:SPOR domain-containing protein [Marinobacter sp. DUT-1]|uniref:SPOR domain-containing protein n=1 Tax=Marinobacter sp. DUT-1 TaxID=3412037 RepID=UPI003D169FDD